MFEKWKAIQRGAPIDGDDMIGRWMLDVQNHPGGAIMIGLVAAAVLGGGGYLGFNAMAPNHVQAQTRTQPQAISTPLGRKVTTANGGGGSGNGPSAVTVKSKTPAKTKPTTKAKAKAKAKAQPKVKLPHVQTLGSSHGVPDFWVAPKGNIFQDATAINDRYIEWGDAKIAQEVPGIAAKGRFAGALTPQMLNSPAALQKYSGPKVPLSLKAAGVTLPVGTPKNGAITGLNLSLMRNALAANPWMKNVSPQQLLGAYQVAAEWTMATMGNSEVSAFRYVWPYLDGSNDQFLMDHEDAGWATDGGQLQNRQVGYQSSVAYHLRPDSVYGAFQLGRDSVSGKQFGDVIANAVILNVPDSIIGTGMVNGRLEIGSFPVTAGYVYVTLVRNSNQERWFVTGSQNFTGTNKPTQVYWTAPQGG